MLHHASEELNPENSLTNALALIFHYRHARRFMGCFKEIENAIQNLLYVSKKIINSLNYIFDPVLILFRRRKDNLHNAIFGI